MDSKPLVYVSGPMTGLPDHNYPAFDDAAATLRELGYEVINPAETAGGTIHLPRSTFLRIDVGYVMAAEAIALLPGWSNSKGSKLEVLVAEAMDLPIHLYCPQRGLGRRLEIDEVTISCSWPEEDREPVSDTRAFLDQVAPQVEYWEDVKGLGYVCEGYLMDYVECAGYALARNPNGRAYGEPGYLCAEHCNEAGIRIKPNVGSGCGA